MSDIDSDFFEAKPVARRRGRGFGIFVFVLLGIVVVLGILAVVADLVVRTVAEDQAEKQISQQLGDAAGPVDVQIGGFSMLWQLVQGTIEQATISSAGSSGGLSFDFDVRDVPTDLSGSTGAITGTVTADAATVNGLAAVQESGGAISFGDGQVTYARDFTIPLVNTVVPVDVVATPSITSEGRVISLTPTTASLRDTSVSLDLAPFIGGYAFDVCAAQYLPQGTTLTAVDVTPSAATLDVTSPGLPISSSGIGTKGSCS